MPFIRQARDKRGYETTYVMHAYRPAQGPQRTRVLYLFRSPSHIKMGRHPLDEEIREALEHTHPDVSFDWSALGRESISVRPDDRDRERDRDRHHRGERQERRGASAHGRPPAAAPATVPVVLEDHSMLGRALGAERAAQLRAQYGELLQRIARRSRTPEDRDRLTQRAQRLNPDDWPDESEIKAHVDTIQAEWEALSAELPSRRRGRRGGRRRERPEGDAPAVAFDPDASEESDEGTSGIMADGGNLERDVETAPVDRSDRAADPRGDHRGDGAERADEPAGDGLPGDD